MMKRNLKTLPFHRTWDRNLPTSIIKIPDTWKKTTRKLQNICSLYTMHLLSLAQLQLAHPLPAYSGPQPTPAKDHTRWPMCRALGELWITSECKGKASDLPDLFLYMIYAGLGPIFCTKDVIRKNTRTWYSEFSWKSQPYSTSSTAREW